MPFPVTEVRHLRALARALGVHTRYTDGLGQRIAVAPDTLVQVCAALGASITHPRHAAVALRELRHAARTDRLPPVLVAWDGTGPPMALPAGPLEARLDLEDGDVVHLGHQAGKLHWPRPLPFGYHRLTVEQGGRTDTVSIIAAPVRAWRRPDSRRSWGVAAQLAALRSARSRSVGDLRDLESLCRWVGERGGDLVMVLPLLPTFNGASPEPSPYSPVSRLFWSELMLDLGDVHQPTEPPATLDVTRADAEVRAALADVPVPDAALQDGELVRYARFRGAQAVLGRRWRAWAPPARTGTLGPADVDPAEERFHLVAQSVARRQLRDLRERLDAEGFRLALDLAVGGNPDGYDPWSRPSLFADGMSVGAPPDRGFPSGQDWGFSPVLPGASRDEGHRYLAACIRHQMQLAGVLRVDHVMALGRLYWIPDGFGLHEGTYVSYPADELFAILTLESHRHRCEVVGENLGTVPAEIDEALPRHGIWGTYVAQFQASRRPPVRPPASTEVASIGTHDTPTFAGWLEAADVAERIAHGLLAADRAATVRRERVRATRRLARHLGCHVTDPRAFLEEVLAWLGRSESPLVIAWIEDLWLEGRGVNLPGTRSSDRPNWQRPMGRLLDDIFSDPDAERLLRGLDGARAV